MKYGPIPGFSWWSQQSFITVTDTTENSASVWPEQALGRSEMFFWNKD